MFTKNPPLHSDDIHAILFFFFFNVALKFLFMPFYSKVCFPMLAYASRSRKFNQDNLKIIGLIRPFLDLRLTVFEKKNERSYEYF